VPAAQDLTTLANAKSWLSIPVGTTTDDALIQRLITAISVAIAGYCSQGLVSQAYTETRNGTGGSQLMLRQGPITAVASVTIDGISIPARTAPGQAGFYFDTDFLYVDGYSFTRPGTSPALYLRSSGAGAQNVVIAYTAGYTPIPGDLEQACIELLAVRFKSRERIGMKSKMMGQETMAYDLTAIPDSVKSMLQQQYVRVVPNP
jgi:uncharacterized phiE125 gp8 family phage protein